jgi:uncharacterized protein YdbL (DUF1318 family)
MHLKKLIQRALGAVSLSLLMALPAFALDLGEAKSEGLVGETNTGYIAAIKPSKDVDTVVADINSQRKAYYQEIATKNGISLQAVEVRAGQKAIEKTSAGEYINTGDGWQRK